MLSTLFVVSILNAISAGRITFFLYISSILLIGKILYQVGELSGATITEIVDKVAQKEIDDKDPVQIILKKRELLLYNRDSILFNSKKIKGLEDSLKPVLQEILYAKDLIALDTSLNEFEYILNQYDIPIQEIFK